LIGYRPNEKWRLQKFFVAAGTSLPRCYLATIGGYALPRICLAAIGGVYVHT
jgi:hypothetical protein